MSKENPGKIYEKYKVKIGDKISFDYGLSKKIGIIISPKEVKGTNQIIDGDNFLYIKEEDGFKLGYKGNLINFKILNKNVINNDINLYYCSECNIIGEFINGAVKCPKCWKVW